MVVKGDEKLGGEANFLRLKAVLIETDTGLTLTNNDGYQVSSLGN